LVTGRKLLLADDSATIQKVVDLTFTDEGMEVIAVSDGQEAVEKLEEIVPDIVLADVFMPGLNGYEVCEHIKQNDRFRHIPVMLLVGSFEPFDEAEARRVGADDYLTKPFQSIRTLIGKVRNLLSGGAGGTEDATTRKLAPPPEAEKENRPDAEFLARSTADTAPLPEEQQEEVEDSSIREVSFADLSLDDEMIKATPADSYGSTSQTMRDEPQAPQTAQYSASDLKDAGIAESFKSTAAAERHEAVGSYASAQAGEPLQAAAGGMQASTGYSATDDALLDLGDLEPPQAQAEADDFFLDLLDEAAEPTRAPASSPGSLPDTTRDSAHRSSTSGDYAAERGKSWEEERDSVSSQVTEEQPMPLQYAATELLPDDFQIEGMPGRKADAGSGYDTEAAGGGRSGTGQTTLDQLSPETIDAIARRAVELLSAKVVEQIAWEVVPELADLAIKRRLADEKKQ